MCGSTHDLFQPSSRVAIWEWESSVPNSVGFSKEADNLGVFFIFDGKSALFKILAQIFENPV